MGFCLYGNDINDNTSPIEAGLSWITKTNKIFTSSNIFKNQKEKGVNKKLIGFKMLEKSIPRKDYEILNSDHKIIGVVTSGTMSPSLNFGIGLGYVKSGFEEIDTEIFIKIRKQVNFEKCTICRQNFIKSSINMINIYNPFFLDDELDNELDNTCPYCLRIDFIIKFILLLSYIILSSFLFGNLIVQNYLYDNTNINKEFTYNLLTFGFGLLASIVSLICMYTVYKLFISINFN